MNAIDQYVAQVLSHLPPAMPGREKIADDLVEHLDASVEAGATQEEAIARMGDPRLVAEGFLESAPKPEIADPWRRVGAFAVDLGIGINVLAAIPMLIMVVHARGPEVNPLLSMAEYGFVLIAVAGMLLSIFYFPVMEARTGQTLGKKAFGLMVVRENGSRIGWSEAWIRRIPMFFQFIWIDGMFTIFTEKKQRAFDMVAKTIVVRTDDESPARGVRMLVFLIAIPIGAVLLSWTLDHFFHNP